MAGGILSDAVGYRPIFFIVAGACAVAGLLVFFLVHEVREEAAGGAKARPIGLGENVRFAAGDVRLRNLLLLIFLTQTPVAVIRPVFALFAETFSMPADRVGTMTGLVYGVNGLFFAISSPWWGRRFDRNPTPSALLVPLGGAAFLYALHPFAPSLGWLFPIRAALGFFLGGTLSVCYSLISARAPVERRGGVMGIASSMNMLAALVGPLAGGLIVARWGFDLAFALSAALLVVSLIPVRRVALARAREAPGAPSAALESAP
jgi:MFS family permease